MKTLLLASFLAFSVHLVTSAAATLPASLEHALARHDPFALADTTLPRLPQLDAAQRGALAERLSGW